MEANSNFIFDKAFNSFIQLKLANNFIERSLSSLFPKNNIETTRATIKIVESLLACPYSEIYKSPKAAFISEYKKEAKTFDEEVRMMLEAYSIWNYQSNEKQSYYEKVQKSSEEYYEKMSTAIQKDKATKSFRDFAMDYVRVNMNLKISTCNFEETLQNIDTAKIILSYIESRANMNNVKIHKRQMESNFSDYSVNTSIITNIFKNISQYSNNIGIALDIVKQEEKRYVKLFKKGNKILNNYWICIMKNAIEIYEQFYSAKTFFIFEKLTENHSLNYDTLSVQFAFLTDFQKQYYQEVSSIAKEEEKEEMSEEEDEEYQ